MYEVIEDKVTETSKPVVKLYIDKLKCLITDIIQGFRQRVKRLQKNKFLSKIPSPKGRQVF